MYGPALHSVPRKLVAASLRRFPSRFLLLQKQNGHPEGWPPLLVGIEEPELPLALPVDQVAKGGG
jgi:hypothetical protein